MAARCWLTRCRRSMTLAAAALWTLLAVGIAQAAPVTVPPTNPMPPAGTRYMGPQNPSPQVPVMWEMLGSIPIVAVHLSILPGTDDVMFVQRTESEFKTTRELDMIVGRFYNGPTPYFRNFSSVNTNGFCAAQAFTADGAYVHIGGSPTSRSGVPAGGLSIRQYTLDMNTLPDTGKMRDPRWYPTVTLMTNKKMFIIGGTATDANTSTPSITYEIYDPAYPAQPTVQYTLEPTHQAYAGQHWYPFNWILPTGHLLTMMNGRSRFFTQDGEYVKTATGAYLEAPTLPDGWSGNYPHTGSAVMLAMRYDAQFVEIVVMGGQQLSYVCNGNRTVTQAALGSRYSYRLPIGWALSATGTYTYTFGTWVKEDMGINRVGGDATLLPNGDVVLTSGVQTGCMGDPVSNVPVGDYGALWPTMYQPEKPVNSRWTILQASTIMHSYHSNAILTRNGTIQIAGCDICRASWYTSPASFWSKNPTGKYEHRNQIFHTPYSLDTANKPSILAIAGITSDTAVVPLTYGKTYNFSWIGPPVSTVALVGPSANTHSFNMVQRVIYLRSIRDQVTRTGSFRIEVNKNYLPPQHYLLFILNQKTYSNARWVKLA